MNLKWKKRLWGKNKTEFGKNIRDFIGPYLCQIKPIKAVYIRRGEGLALEKSILEGTLELYA